jgi:hypothetical protein
MMKNMIMAKKKKNTEVMSKPVEYRIPVYQITNCPKIPPHITRIIATST